MKKIIKKILDSKSLKVAMINMLYMNPTLSAADYARLNMITRNLEKEIPEEVQLKKAS